LNLIVAIKPPSIQYKLFENAILICQSHSKLLEKFFTFKWFIIFTSWLGPLFWWQDMRIYSVFSINTPPAYEDTGVSHSIQRRYWCVPFNSKRILVCPIQFKGDTGVSHSIQRRYWCVPFNSKKILVCPIQFKVDTGVSNSIQSPPGFFELSNGNYKIKVKHNGNKSTLCFKLI